MITEKDTNKCLQCGVEILNGRKFCSVAHRGLYYSGNRNPAKREGVGELISAGVKKYCSDPKVRKKRSDNAKRQLLGPSGANFLKAGREWSKEPENRKKLSDLAKERLADPSERKKCSDRATAQWSDPIKGKIILDSLRTPEHRKTQSIKSTERQADPGYRKMRSFDTKERWETDENWIKNHIEAMQRPETRKKLSINALKYWSNIDVQLPDRLGRRGNGNYFYHPDGRRIWLRSSYETRLAFALTRAGIRWVYEVPLSIGEYHTYRVDFYLYDYDIYLEVKGWMSAEDKEKMISCYHAHPLINLRILYNKDITDLEKVLLVYTRFDMFDTIGISLMDQILEWRL